MSTELTEQPEQLPATDALSLIDKAIERDIDVEKMERLFELRQKMKDEWARDKYFAALSDFQAEVPEIPKQKHVYVRGSYRYSYASLDDIVAHVKGLLQKHGFSYSIHTEQTENKVAAITRVHHEAGHTEESRFSVPIDYEAYMNAQQKVASALTYAKRYAFCNALGILTTDQDDDAQSAGEQGGNEKQPQQKQETQQTQESAESAVDAAYRMTRNHIKRHEDAGNLPQGQLYELYSELEDAHNDANTEWMRSLYKRVTNMAAHAREQKEKEELEQAAEKAFESEEPNRSAVESQLPDTEPGDKPEDEELF